MCLLFFSYDNHPAYRLILAANRDEFFNRPTAPMAFWDDAPNLLAGRDLEAGGTWMGTSRLNQTGGRLAAITNFREIKYKMPDALSRGYLVSDFLKGTDTAAVYAEDIRSRASEYSGFNLIVFDGADLIFFSNRENIIHAVKPGIYGLCNHLLDTPWPKVQKGKQVLKPVFESGEPDMDEIFHILSDQSRSPDHLLPDTGVGLDWERMLSPIFVTSPIYGTRSSSVVMIKKNGEIMIAERTFFMKNGRVETGETRKFQIKI